MAHIDKIWVTRWLDADGKQVAAGTAGARKVRERSTKYYGFNVPGKPRHKRIPLATHRVTAQALLNRMVEDALRGEAGISDRYREHRTRPLAEHLADYGRALEAKGDTAKHVRLVTRQVQALCGGCRFKTLADIEPGRVVDWLAELRRDRTPAALPAGESFAPGRVAALLGGVTLEAVRKLARRHGFRATGQGKQRRYPRAAAETLLAAASRGASIETSNRYLSALKGFCRWAVRDRRIAESPVVHLQGNNAKLDRRHDRRELAPAELLSVLEHVRTAAVAFRGLTGNDRYHLYLCACGTGFRVSELAALLPASFDFRGDVATVTLPTARAKNRKLATQPLPPAVATALRDYLRDRPAGQPIWGGTWRERAADMLRLDLEAVNVPYSVPGPDGPLFADFHSLRHSYISALARSGATVKQAQKLARHSTPELTIGRYAHAELQELGEAVGRLPALTVPAAGPEPLVTIPERDLELLTTLAAIGLALLDTFGRPAEVSVTTPVALTGAPDGTTLGVPGTVGRKPRRKAG